MKKIDFFIQVLTSSFFLPLFFSVLTDNVLVTENGYENLTTVPKEVAEVEGIISPSQ